MKGVIANIISDRQICCVPGRCISENLTYMRDAIFFCDFNKIDGCTLSVDKEKSFDLLDREFLFNVLKKWNSVRNLFRGSKSYMKILQQEFH